MGIYSRDYIRERRPGDTFGGSSDQWAIRFLLIANIVVFVLQNATSQGPRGHPQLVGGATEWLSLSLSDLYSLQIWRLVTYGFCHANVQHLAINLFVLWMFGRAIQPIYGSREFLAFFLAGVVVSGICHLGVQFAESGTGGVIGASGGVMAVVFLTAMVYPRMKVLLFFVIPIELRWLAVMYAVADVFGFIQQEGSNVAHAAHLGGAAFGIAYKYYGWRVSRLWDRLRGSMRTSSSRLSRPKVRLYRPGQEDLDKQVDAILEKIHEQGEASLTDQEREILKTASQKYRKR